MFVCLFVCLITDPNSILQSKCTLNINTSLTIPVNAHDMRRDFRLVCSTFRTFAPVPTYWGRETTSRPISNSQTSAQLKCPVHTSYAPVSGTLSPFPELSASGNVTFHGAQSTTLLGLSAASPRRATGPHLRCGRWYLSSMRLKRVIRLKMQQQVDFFEQRCIE